MTGDSHLSFRSLPQIRLTSGFRAISSNYAATDVRPYGPTANQCFYVRIAAASLVPITISTRSARGRKAHPDLWSADGTICGIIGSCPPGVRAKAIKWHLHGD